MAQATLGGAGGRTASSGGTSSATGTGGNGGNGAFGSPFGGGGGGGAGTLGGAGGDAGGGVISGGQGGLGFGDQGTGGTNGSSGNSGGGGGGGGHGDLVTTDTTNSGAITGGRGGRGGNAVANNRGGGGGGAGGYGVVVDGSGLVYTNNNTIGAGNGGVGGAESGSGGFGGSGGDGGHGIFLTGGGSVNNSSNITGGTGGDGGNASNGTGGSGANGGTGVFFTGTSMLNNSGTVTGGAGGGSGTSSGGGGGGTAGLAGAGVAGGNLTIVNSGSISGGLSSDGFTRANAIAFTGGANTLTLNGGSLTGNVSIAGGNISFNQAGSYNLTNVITGTGSISHDGAGALTLSGVNTYSGGTTISAGTVALNHVDTNNLFDAAGSGGITLDGGKLVGAVTGSLAKDVTFNAGKTSTLAAAAGTVLTIGGDPNTTGNQNARLIFGVNSVAQFGSATDTGVVRVGASSNLSFLDIAPTSELVVAGGTLRDFQDQLFNLTAGVRRTTVNSGATLDFNDSVQQVLVNLNGGGSVMTGTTGANALSVFSTGGTTNTFSGVISGSHPVSFNTTGGNATMILSGDNTYTGGTTVCFCVTLQLGDGGTTGSVVGDIVNENRLIFNRSNTYTFNGVISNIGDVLQNGTGNTVLTATHGYTGDTTVNAGTLTVNGDIRTSNRVIVNSGGTLGGTGFVPDTQIRAGGTLAPGNSVGTMNVAGNLQFITGSTYAVEVSSAGADRTNVSGTATLGGAAVTTNVAAGTNVNKQYTIVNATGGFTGRFNSSVSTNLPSSFVSSLSYDTNNVYLNFALTFPQGSFGDLDQNQQNVGNALTNYFNSTGGIPVAFGLSTLGGLSQLSGEPGATVPTAGFAAMAQFINAMFDSSGGGGSHGAPLGFAQDNDQDNAYAPKRKLSREQTDAYAAVTPRDRMAAPSASRWNVWATGYGGNSTVNGNTASGTHTTSTRVFGTAVGADYRATPNTRFGFALGGAGTNFTVDSGLGGGRADVFQAGAYARHQMGAAYLAGALAYSWQDVTTDRTVTVAGTDKLRASFAANSLAARLEGGWRYAMPAFAVTPYAAVQATTFYLPDYAESATSGSGQFALSYASKNVTATRGELGARFDKAMPLRDTLLTLRARTAWAHDWNTDRSATATFLTLPGATFTVNGAQPSANAALVSAGADLAWTKGWSVAANFDGEFASTTRSYAGRGTLRYVW